MSPGPAGGPGRPESKRHHQRGFAWELFLLFAAVGALSVLADLVPFPVAHLDEVSVAAGFFVASGILVVVLPWSRIPRWWWTAIPIGFIGVLALLRDARGATGTGISAVFIVPVSWLALYGRRSQLAVGLGASLAALVIPTLVVGSPAYPASDWRSIFITEAVATLLGFSVLALVGRERHAADRAAEKSTESLQAAEAAELAHQRLDSLLRAATHTAVIGTDPEGTIVFFSPGAEHLLGYDAADVVGSTRLSTLVDRTELAGNRTAGPVLDPACDSLLDPPPDPLRDPLREPVLDPATDGIHVGKAETWTFILGGGGTRRMATVVTEQGRTEGSVALSGYVVVATDLTEREELLHQRERLLAVQHEVTQVLVEQNHQLRELTEMKDNVVATVSHELRTPLTVIRGFIEILLQEEGGLSQEQVRMLHTIDRNARQLLEVTEDLLDDPGRAEVLRVELVDVDLAALVGESVEALQGEAGHHRVSLAAGTLGKVIVHGDPHRLEQLLVNLVSNALKFTPPGGHVRVEVSDLGRLARLDVADDGPGIPVSERARLFDRFFRLASASSEGIPGSGLGLAVARSVVEAHHGTIAIVDTPGWSTTFRVHLPARTSPNLPPPAISDPTAMQDPTAIPDLPAPEDRPVSRAGS